MKKGTTEQFIQKATSKHGDIYSYNNVIYNKASEKVSITCKIHGDWLQRPNDHLTGYGCPRCKFDLIASQKRGDIQTFINKANLVHNNQYNYNNSKYLNAVTKIEIICNIHGSFYQTPDKHLGGTGCPKCSNGISRGERKIQLILDSMNIIYEREKRFPGLVGSTANSRLRYDFWLPNYNTLIEYDGEQHFSPTNIKGRIPQIDIISKYQSTIFNDIRKNEYAKQMGYRLIRIPFTDFNNLDIQYFNNLALE